MNAAIKSITRLLICLLGLTVMACSNDEKIGVSYHAYNHTDKGIYPIFINGEGGILDAAAHGEGGGVCCVLLPKSWKPGLLVTIKWRNDSTYQLDAKGDVVTNDGVPVLIASPWKEKTVEVPNYSYEELNYGTFFIHFYPDGEVKVLVNKYLAGNRNHPLPHPSGYKRED